MNFFRTVVKNMSALGFVPNQQQNSSRELSLRQITVAIIYFINIALIGLGIFSENYTTKEYIYAIFALISFIAITIIFISFTLKNDEIFNTIECIAKESDFSKCSLFKYLQSLH